jgi:hypothetical protein
MLNVIVIPSHYQQKAIGVVLENQPDNFNPLRIEFVQLASKTSLRRRGFA